MQIYYDRVCFGIGINGNPLPKNFSKEKLFRKYVTTDPDKGSGIGGYDIKRIADIIFDSWDLEIYPDKNGEYFTDNDKTDLYTKLKLIYSFDLKKN